MGRIHFAAWVGALVIAGCDSRLPVPPPAAESRAITVELSPPSSPEAIPRVAHVLLKSAVPAGAKADAVALVLGEVGPRHVDQIAQGEPSDALIERIVPASIIASGDDVWIIPHIALEIGERYDVVVGSLEQTFPLVVDPLAPSPLERLWPPPDISVAEPALFYCGAAQLESEAQGVALFPEGPAGSFEVGSPAGAARHCVRFDPEAMSAEGTWLAPPAIGDAGLAPGPILVGDASGAAPLTCTEVEISLGPGCAEVEDDRFTLRTPEAPVLWVISGPGLDLAFATEASSARVIKGLVPASDVALSVETLDAAGTWKGETAMFTTAPSRPHFVLNEVYANPIGAEPDQEWVEIVNDGQVGGDLGGLVLEDIGGATVLPAAWVDPGLMAVVVNDTFSADGEYDTAPATGAALLRVEKLGKNGLSNSGEPLKLTIADGTVISRFPPLPKPKAGASVMRVTPEAPDGVESSFVLSTAPTPGAPNH